MAISSEELAKIAIQSKRIADILEELVKILREVSQK